MTAAHLETLQRFMDPVAKRLPKGVRLTCKHFFSGAAAYANGRICISLTPAGLAMKLPEESRARLRQDGGKALRYFPKAPIKKDYVVLPPAIRDDARKRNFWARKSIAYALTLPPPKKPKRKS